MTSYDDHKGSTNLYPVTELFVSLGTKFYIISAYYGSIKRALRVGLIYKLMFYGYGI